MNANCSDVYCNPLPLPEYPQGMLCRRGQYRPDSYIGTPGDYRELADPEMLYHDGVWYMFPSGRQAYVSTDLAHWEYRPVVVEGELGYAPTVARCRGKFYLTASVLCGMSGARLYEAPEPLGPYRPLGEVRGPGGAPLPTEFLDPSLFCDDDGRLYLYWGYGPDGGGIFGMELDSADPVCGITPPLRLIDFDGRNEFERFGDHHEHGDWGYLEGAAMFKHNGVYYLQYAACGTVFRNYALGVRTASSPLGTFTAQKEPLMLTPHGIVCGTGHGGMVRGPGDTVWQFYTCLVRRKGVFERRVGMDRVEFSPDGTARVRATATPQSVREGDLGLVPVSVNKPVRVSSCRNEHWGNFANDDCTHTWFAPEREDAQPYWEVNLRKDFDVTAVRILWCEFDLDYRRGIVPEPVKFKIEFFDAEHRLLPGTVDATGNDIDRIVDFRIFQPVRARFVRLSWQRGRKIDLGLTECTVFAPPAPVRVF